MTSSVQCPICAIRYTAPHVCPPKWQALVSVTGDGFPDKDAWATTVYAYDSASAAEKAAEAYDGDSDDNLIACGAKTRVEVTGPYHSIIPGVTYPTHAFTIEGEFVPSYVAYTVNEDDPDYESDTAE